MRAFACLAICSFLVGCFAVISSAQEKKADAAKQPANGIYGVLRESDIEKSVLPIKAGEALIVHRHRYSKEKESPIYLVIRSAPDVEITLVGEPKVERSGDDVLSIGLKLQPTAAKALEKLTANPCYITIIVGGDVVTMHKVREPIKSGELQITSCAAGAAKYLLEQLQMHRRMK